MKDVPVLKEIKEKQASCKELTELCAKFLSRFVVDAANAVDLVCDNSKGLRIFVPQSMREIIFERIHSLDHPGVRQTRNNIAKSFVWPRLDKFVKAMVGACLACQKAKVFKHDIRPLAHFPLPNARFDHIHLDFVGPLPPSKGN